MVKLLQIIGWFGIAASIINGYFKLFGNEYELKRYAGSTRNLDLNISVLAFCLIFLALAAILSELRKMNKGDNK